MIHRGVSFKLMCMVAISVVAFVGLGIYGISNTAATFTWVGQVYTTAEDFRDSSQKLANPLNQLRQLSLSIVMAPNPELRDELHDQQHALTRQIDATFAGWPVESEDTQAQAAFSELRTSWEDYKKIKDVTVDKALAALPRGSVHQRHRRGTAAVRGSQPPVAGVDAAEN